MKLKCDTCRYKKMCYRRYNPIGDKYSHTDNCEYYEKYEPKPLPKGHGRLIDGDILHKDFEDRGMSWEAKLIDHAPTIIEADKEGDEK